MNFRIKVLTTNTVQVCRPPSPNHNMVNNITEEEGVMIAEWCKEHKCGKRTAFNIFWFDDRDEISMFMLRWAS